MANTLAPGIALVAALLAWGAAPVALAQPSGEARQASSQASPADAGRGGEQNIESRDSRSRSPVWALEGDLAGKLQMITTRYEDTFAEIGTQRSLGYLELVKANPGIDPWLPGDGTRVTLPRKYVLPDSRREGIVINLAEYRLYYFRDGGVQVFPVGVGTEDNPSPLTDAVITMGLESPAWYPPASIRAEYEANGEHLPRMIPPGPDNPLGTHALILSEKGYLIHGTNKGFGVGMQVSHGCFRMYNDDISRFVNEVPKGTPVQVVHQPVKVGLRNGQLWLEVHRTNEEYPEEEKERLWQQVTDAVEAYTEENKGLEVQRRVVEQVVEKADGIPRMIGERVTQLASRDENTDRSASTRMTEGSGPSTGDSSQGFPQRWF